MRRGGKRIRRDAACCGSTNGGGRARSRFNHGRLTPSTGSAPDRGRYAKLALPPPFVLPQHAHRARSSFSPRASMYDLGQHRGIEQSKVHTLPRQRMHDVSGITDEPAQRCATYLCADIAEEERHPFSTSRGRVPARDPMRDPAQRQIPQVKPARRVFCKIVVRGPDDRACTSRAAETPTCRLA